MRACRQIALREIPSAPRRFVVDTNVGPGTLKRLTDPQVARQPLRDGTFLWVDVATAPGSAVLLGPDISGGDGDGAAVATHVDLLALGADPGTSGIVRLHSDAEIWLPCCGAGIDGCLAFNGRRCSLALEHLLDDDELLPIPRIAAGYPSAPIGERPVIVAGEPCERLHCLGVVLTAGQVWSLWSDTRGAPRSWELHSGGDDLAVELHTPRHARPHRAGHIRSDGREVDLGFPHAESLEALCRTVVFGVRVLGH
jgi:hypothetical protein